MQCIDSFSEYQNPKDEAAGAILSLTAEQEEEDFALASDEKGLNGRTEEITSESIECHIEEGLGDEQPASIQRSERIVLDEGIEDDEPDDECACRAFSTLPVVPAVLVLSDEEDPFRNYQQDSLRKVKERQDAPAQRSSPIILGTTVCLLLAIVLALGLGFGLANGLRTSQSSISATPTVAPTNIDDTQTIPPTVAFETTQELYDAVDRWLAGENTANTNLAATYGYPIGQWDVSRITNFSQLFYACKYCSRPPGRTPLANTFNDDISMWNVSNARDMSYMFRSAAAFNGDLSKWDVSHVTDMTRMFRYATSFNGNISVWDVSQVISMESMFFYSSAFNDDISRWNVSKVNSMTNMFFVAAVFNQDLCEWGSYLPAWASTVNAFRYSACPFENDPMLNATPPGPFCHYCGKTR